MARARRGRQTELGADVFDRIALLADSAETAQEKRLAQTLKGALGLIGAALLGVRVGATTDPQEALQRAVAISAGAVYGPPMADPAVQQRVAELALAFTADVHAVVTERSSL